MVYRVYVEKKKGLAHEAAALLNDIRTNLGVTSLKNIRIFNRYDVENISKELFDDAISAVFSEPMVDDVYNELPNLEDAYIFAVEFLPGQYDQRADSAAQCIQLISQKDRPLVRTAKVYALFGELTESEIGAIKKHLINPVESREAALELPQTLNLDYDIPQTVETLDGFIDLKDEDIKEFVKKYALAMDEDDLKFCIEYFKSEGRNPTITELRVLDTYWSDHCRHTTFLTTIDSVEIDDAEIKSAYDLYLTLRAETGRADKKINLMDIATIGARYLKKQGLLEKLDESDEINACTVKIDVDIDGENEEWLLLFKNETHNHPTEIEPFGGAATCIGGAIRDPLSGRAYVYQAMRVTGAGNPLKPLSETIEGKLPQRKIVTTAADGYSSYGNQIGLATGLVDEIYHEGYVAKRLEIGAVVGAVPKKNVRREVPAKGDLVILVGGRTGRDGCGGATGSSKSHDSSSIEKSGAEVQKGNAPEERKLQRLFRNPEVVRLIKRCNDFGAGGVSVAVGEIADSLRINLNKVKKKYEGLDGTELAISESQERMAVVVEEKDAEKFIAFANEENLEATVIAEVTDNNRLVMEWNGRVIVDISRDFLNSNGAEKHTKVKVKTPADWNNIKAATDFTTAIKELAGDLNVCSKKGLSERFDSTIGAGTVLMPFGGKYQMTPPMAMAAKIPVLNGNTNTCSVMSWGYNPFIAEKSPYHSAYLAVVESVAKLISAGAPLDDCYLTFQEYFPRPGSDPERWGMPLAALLGALKAQTDLKIASVGGKDSMSGTFENLDVPPTLVSFAISVAKTDNIISPEFKKAGNKVYLISPEYSKNGLPVAESLKAVFQRVHKLISSKTVISASAPTYGGILADIMKMCFGNRLGFRFSDTIDLKQLISYAYGSIIVESPEKLTDAILLGEVTGEYTLRFKGESVSLTEIQEIYENKLESVFPTKPKTETSEKPQRFEFKNDKLFAAKTKVSRPKMLIPVFPGTNCEYDTMRAAEKAGLETEIFIIKNLNSADVAESITEFAKRIESSQIIFIPGGFSGGDEPDGSGKFITAFFRNPLITEKVRELLKIRDGLMCGICNGFQALIKLGLVPFGDILEADASFPTLTFNTIGRHQSMIVRTVIASNNSPWLMNTNVGNIYSVPISHGEGRFICSDELMSELAANGQIATQYVDLDSEPTYDIRFNPNGSFHAVEGILSPDGRVFGKMGHSERIGDGLYKNVPGNYDIGLFDSAYKYYNI